MLAQRAESSILFIWFFWFLWFNERNNQTNQTNEIDEIDHPQVLPLSPISHQGPWTRAVEDQSAPTLERYQESLEGACISSDARSERQPGHSPNSLRPRFLLQTREIEYPGFLSLAALKDMLIGNHGKIQQGS